MNNSDNPTHAVDIVKNKLTLSPLAEGYYVLKKLRSTHQSNLPLKDYKRFDWEHEFAGWSPRGIPLSSKTPTNRLTFDGASWLKKPINDGSDLIDREYLSKVIFKVGEVEVYYVGKPGHLGPGQIAVPRGSYLPYDARRILSYGDYSLKGYRGDKFAWVAEFETHLAIWYSYERLCFSGRLTEAEWLDVGYVFAGDKYVCDCSEQFSEDIFVPCRYVGQFPVEHGLNRPSNARLSYNRARNGYFASEVVIKDREKAVKLWPWIKRMPKLKRIRVGYSRGDMVPFAQLASFDYLAQEIEIYGKDASIDPLLVVPDKGQVAIVGNRIVARTGDDVRLAARTVRDLAREYHIPDKSPRYRGCVGRADVPGDCFILKGSVANLTTKAGREARHRRLRERFGSVPANWDLLSDAEFDEHERILQDAAARKIVPLEEVDFKDLAFLRQHLDPSSIDPSIVRRWDPVDGMWYYPPAMDLGPKLLADEKRINGLLSRLYGREMLMFIAWLAKRCPGDDLLYLLSSILKKEHGVEFHETMEL